ncbi:MAG: hypothetical protein HZA67_02080 [Rhodospirillales bacterium]|nr:hypothetical protein [Rhodospirillales bacterium]
MNSAEILIEKMNAIQRQQSQGTLPSFEDVHHYQRFERQLLIQRAIDMLKK